MLNDFEIGFSAPEERGGILNLHRTAFPDEPSVATLTGELLRDPSAMPLVSLVARDGNRVIGHILFTRARLEPAVSSPVFILAPLAILPEHQNSGMGGKLIAAGLEELRKAGPCLVFVLGHPGYYPKFVFQPAGAQGLHAPYPIPEKHADAWMVQPLGMALPSGYEGTVRCADALDHVEHWVE